MVEDRENARHREESGSIIVGNTVMSPIDVFPRPDARQPGRTRPDSTAGAEPVLSRNSSPTDVVLFRNGAAPEYIPESQAQSVLTPRISNVDHEEATIDLKNVSHNAEYGHSALLFANTYHVRRSTGSTTVCQTCLSGFIQCILTCSGPGSWLSICSEPGIRWVSVRAKSSGFGDIARGLITDWTQHLSFSQCPIQKAGSEPDFEEAWQYATGAFNSLHKPHLSLELTKSKPILSTPTTVYLVSCIGRNLRTICVDTIKGPTPKMTTLPRMRCEMPSLPWAAEPLRP
jgi:hypothetical protein